MTKYIDEQEEQLERWLAERREVKPPAELSDQIMNRVVKLEHSRRNPQPSRLLDWVERSWAVRWAVCGGAFAVGGFPFLLLARVAHFL